jgi:hypothetical protein
MDSYLDEYDDDDNLLLPEVKYDPKTSSFKAFKPNIYEKFVYFTTAQKTAGELFELVQPFVTGPIAKLDPEMWMNRFKASNTYQTFLAAHDDMLTPGKAYLRIPQKGTGSEYQRIELYTDQDYDKEISLIHYGPSQAATREFLMVPFVQRGKTLKFMTQTFASPIGPSTLLLLESMGYTLTSTASQVC